MCLSLDLFNTGWCHSLNPLDTSSLCRSLNPFDTGPCHYFFDKDLCLRFVSICSTQASTIPESIQHSLISFMESVPHRLRSTQAHAVPFNTGHQCHSLIHSTQACVTPWICLTQACVYPWIHLTQAGVIPWILTHKLLVSFLEFVRHRPMPFFNPFDKDLCRSLNPFDNLLRLSINPVWLKPPAIPFDTGLCHSLIHSTQTHVALWICLT